MVDYGRCATNVAPQLARNIVVAAPAGIPARQQERRLIGLSKGCLPAGSRVPTFFLRFGLAEAGYQRAIAEGASLPEPSIRRAMPTTDGSPLAVAAACLTYRAPQAARRILSSAPGSEAERSAMTDGFAGTPGCGTVGEETLRYLASLRGYLAIAGYNSLT